ncbi:MAG: hypothetical protein JWN69_711 [Alphaproteobacteria bacterium]|nr:hypothetical protein [Alphaproteobacteria bacterium]
MPARKPPSDDSNASSAETRTAQASAASDSGAHDADGKESDPKRNKKLATRVAFGIGSAAIVAALLYAGRKVSDRDK